VVFTDLSAVAELSAFCYLASLILIHLVLIISHFKDPNKTRHFVTPLYPLVPIIGIIVNGAAIILLSPLILLLGVGWLFLGMIAWFFLSQKIRGFYKMRLAAGRIKKWLSKDKK
jgi:amino acid transporter